MRLFHSARAVKDKVGRGVYEIKVKLKAGTVFDKLMALQSATIFQAG
jgi:hypothetical protein